jgi:hypothetical protein
MTWGVFLYAYFHMYIIFDYILLRSLMHFLIGLFFLLLNFKSNLHILNESFNRHFFCKYSTPPQTVTDHFIALTMSLTEQRFF